MSKLQTPQETLSLKLDMGTKQETVVLTPDDYYLLVRAEQTVPVIRHDALLRIADNKGIFIDKTVLEFGSWNSPTNFCFIHRAFKTVGGKAIDEVGEANPKNLETFVSSAYPAIMSNKRAQDRLLIRLMGLAGQIYSDVEISANGCEKEEKTAATEPATPRKATKTKAPVEAAPVAEQETQPELPPVEEVVEDVSEDITEDITEETEMPLASEEAPQPPVVETPVPEATVPVVENGDGLTLASARAMIVDYGAKFSKAPVTLGELKEKHPESFDWLLTNKSLSSVKMKSLRAAAEFLRNAETGN